MSGIRCSGTAELSISSNGRRIVWTKENRWSDLWLLTLDEFSEIGFTTKKVSELATRHSWPAFSPDGQKLAYQALLGNGEGHIFVVSTNGRNRKRITYDNLINFSPAWSQDGKKIAFGTAYKRGDDYKVAVMDLESGSSTVFKNTQISENELKVIWNPGEKIIYQDSHLRF